MFQFPGLPSHRLCIDLWILKHYLKCVPAFGNLRIIGYLLLPAAYRSLSRPSSAPGAKASALCSLLLDLFQIPTPAFMCGIFYYCFTRSENFLVFSVNQWNCILRSLSEPTKFWKTLLWFISISFSLLTCLYTIWYFIQFSRYIPNLSVCGGE